MNVRLIILFAVLIVSCATEKVDTRKHETLTGEAIIAVQPFSPIDNATAFMDTICIFVQTNITIDYTHGVLTHTPQWEVVYKVPPEAVLSNSSAKIIHWYSTKARRDSVGN